MPVWKKLSLCVHKDFWVRMSDLCFGSSLVSDSAIHGSRFVRAASLQLLNCELCKHHWLWFRTVAYFPSCPEGRQLGPLKYPTNAEWSLSILMLPLPIFCCVDYHHRGGICCGAKRAFKKCPWFWPLFPSNHPFVTFGSPTSGWLIKKEWQLCGLQVQFWIGKCQIHDFKSRCTIT